ncbi:hypothetical protein GGI25_000136 [Coemansia spiralis]|uniref:N-acetyltransferase domain-containing protein n=2 Tax=Coemansia TaxID=4863 RepID=A0A9W8GDI0_9FUNG|nr:GNAT domain-containing protein [Coemansia spiralis]KAJ1992465.1 hypothetical protein EDC05_002782 [Coemansia umbellata]KAJ2621794.1 hypothetical protein GGI26_003774 [Coemansia sp. RSA 1358]KAJ2681181.1 hypothetical protein GGI25_000136 [Coemansia spiralis]
MRANEHLAIIGNQAILVPYEKEHVPKYHEWMKSPFLQEMTGSEPLSIDEEYEMQQSWRNDDDNPQATLQPYNFHDTTRMIGDINFYLNNHHNPHEAELEVMIAEQGHSGRGIATEVLKLMMHYAISDVGVTDFVVRIKETNDASIYIFEEKFGFVESERSAVFKEITLRRQVDEELKSNLFAWIERNSSRVEFKNK